MPSDAIVDMFPFPFHLALAQELHAILADIYPTTRQALFVAERAGMSPQMLYVDQPAFYLWRDILADSAKAMKTRNVVKAARDLNPTSPRGSFLDALLASEMPAIEMQPRSADGAPKFITSNDSVSVEEALLYHDDLTLEIGRVPWLIKVLQGLITVAPSVCKLTVGLPGKEGRGTGFRIGDDLLLTNWHVMYPEGGNPTGVIAEFGFDDDGKGGGLTSTAVQCDPKTIRGVKDDDWAVITVTDPVPGSAPILKLSDAAAPVTSGSAFIIQHPGGGRKRVAYVRNQITEFDDRVVQYLSDTQSGSSGSPVLNEEGKLIAVHHLGGRPQEVADKPPLRKNEGIRISRILDGLANLNVVVP